MVATATEPNETPTTVPYREKAPAPPADQREGTRHRAPLDGNHRPRNPEELPGLILTTYYMDPDLDSPKLQPIGHHLYLD